MIREICWFLKKKKSLYEISSSLQGRTFVVTGASSGIGLETARELYRANGTVLMLCRNMTKARTCVDDIRQSAPESQGQLRIFQCNFSSLASVRECAEEVLVAFHNIHVLINNAGMSGPEQKIMTSDDLEMTMATNYFGPFLLTSLLLPAVQRTSGRVVNVSSLMHYMCCWRRYRWSPDFMNFELASDKYSGISAYSRSKLCQILFTRHLATLHKGQTTHLVVHPGAVSTPITMPFLGYLLGRYAPKFHIVAFAINEKFFKVFGHRLLKTPREGASTTLFAAVESDIDSGSYLWDCEVVDPWGHLATNDQLAQTVFNKSKQLVGIED